jgi:hypothetical protein
MSGFDLAAPRTSPNAEDFSGSSWNRLAIPSAPERFDSGGEEEGGGLRRKVSVSSGGKDRWSPVGGRAGGEGRGGGGRKKGRS